MFENYLTSEMTGCLGAWDTFEARVSARRDENVVMAYRGDCDGLVAAAFLLHTLRGHGVDVPRSRLLWVPVEDHDYYQLRDFVRDQKPAFVICLGLPLENAPEVAADLVESVGQSVFCFDHHLRTGEVPSLDRLVVVNPTPTLELVRSNPMPASLFGYLCAERAGREAAPWLVGVAMVAEGVEDQMSFFFEELSRLHDLPSPGMVGGTAGLRQTIYGRIGRLLGANFSSREPDHLAMALVRDVLRGEIPGPDELLDAAGEKLARLANSITTEVRRHIDTWKQRITAYLQDVPMVKVEVASEFSVAGPVAAMLLSHFSDKVFVTYSTRAGAAYIELRAPSGGASVIEVLAEAASKVPPHSYGGTSTTGYATLKEDDLSAFLDALSSKLDPDWDDDEEDDD